MSIYGNFTTMPQYCSKVLNHCMFYGSITNLHFVPLFQLKRCQLRKKRSCYLLMLEIKHAKEKSTNLKKKIDN